MSKGRLQGTLVAWAEWILKGKEVWEMDLLADWTELLERHQGDFEV